MKTVLFVGAGRHQRRAILRAKELGVRVAAVDRNPEAPGLQDADEPRVADFSDTRAVLEAAADIRPDGVLTVAADRAVPVVAAVAEELGLAGIGRDAADRATNKLAMRQALAEANVPQPDFAPIRKAKDVAAAAKAVGFPAVLKPADSSGQRGLFRVASLGELQNRLPEALSHSSTSEAILERFHEGLEVNCLAVVRNGDVTLVTLSDRRRPDGIGFGVCLLHVYPASLEGDPLREVERVAAESVRALGLVDSVVYPQLLVSTDGVRAVEVAARIPGGQMDEVARYGAGIDLVDVAVRQALGEEVPNEVCVPRVQQPLAIRFLTAEPGPLRAGVVLQVSGVQAAGEAPGIVRVETYIAEGETIRPVQVDGDRRGYVIALGETPEQALARADTAAALIRVDV